MRELSDAEKGWLAGIIDADGSVILRERTDRHGYLATVKIANNDRAVIDRLCELIPEAKVYNQKNDEYDSDIWYQFCVHRQGVLSDLLQQIGDELTSVKSEKAIIVKEFLQARKEKRFFGEKEDELYDRFTSVG